MADLTAAPAGHDGAVIEVPCRGRRWLPARPFIDGGIASGIRIPQILAGTWTAYTDAGPAPFRLIEGDWSDAAAAHPEACGQLSVRREAGRVAVVQEQGAGHAERPAAPGPDGVDPRPGLPRP